MVERVGVITNPRKGQQEVSAERPQRQTEANLDQDFRVQHNKSRSERQSRGQNQSSDVVSN